MALTSPANVTVNIYRGFDVSNPYPLEGTKADVAGVRGHLRQHMQAGRFGYAAASLHWTHLLELSPNVDVRGAYDSQLVVEAAADSDTVLVKDYPIKGRCTAFRVVLVQRGDRGQPNDHLKVYLDRLRPRQGGCFVPGVEQSCGACMVSPTSWKLTTASDYTNNGCGNCTSLNGGTWFLDWVGPAGYGGGCEWKSASFGSICSPSEEPTATGPVAWQLYHDFDSSWKLWIVNSLVALLAFSPIPDASWNCAGPNTFTGPIWLFGTCASTSSVTLTRG